MRFRLLVCILAAVAAGFAHHSLPPGQFEETPSDVQGVVKEVRWIGPHVWVMLEVKAADGEVQLWPLEGASRASLETIGITADSIKSGDSIKARCRVHKNLRKGQDHDCILGFLKTRDGNAKDWSGRNEPVPAGF